MDRLLALVGLRFRLDLRAMMRTRERLLGLLVLLPGLLLFSGFTATAAFVGVRALSSADPDGVLPALTLVATFVGVFWALSPLLSGVALTESHDVSRLLHFPVPLSLLVVSSLVANLAQPLVLAELPVIAALAFALAGSSRTLPATLFGVAASFVFMIAAAQCVSLLLHGAARRRRLHDLSIFLGLAVGFVLSLLPIVLLSGGFRAAAPVLRTLLERDVLALSPFGWGLRCAVYAGQGQLRGALVYGALALLAIVAVGSLSAWLLGRIHRGELAVGPADAGLGARARMRLPGAIGALVEKDLRAAWRDPALKASLFMGLIGPLLLVMAFARGARQDADATPIAMLAVFLGVSGYGANAFGLERRGISLLLLMPVERWRILVAKNVGAIVLRLPGLLTLSVATVMLASPALLPAALSLAFIVLLGASAVDNFASILFPVPLPDAGRNPWGGASAGSRGLAGSLLSLLLVAVSALVAAPFAFLAWLPVLLREPRLWIVCLPLGVAGALAVYAMLVAWAARVLERREPEVLERMLGEA